VFPCLDIVKVYTCGCKSDVARKVKGIVGMKEVLSKTIIGIFSTNHFHNVLL
jgi:hypothetical protein